jgi:Glycosyltransferases involved in cell wall biogenesis
MKKKTLVFTATYNEFENIQNFITAVHNNNPEVDILIIDDNSPDKTYELVEDLGKKINNIFLIKRSHKLGLDTAHKEAYEFALANKYEYLITMDADLSHDPKEISNFVKYLENHEFVIGSRYMVGGECLMS